MTMDAIRDSVNTMSVLSVIVHIQKFMQVAPFTDPHLFGEELEGFEVATRCF